MFGLGRAFGAASDAYQQEKIRQHDQQQSDELHALRMEGQTLHNAGFGLGNALKQNAVDRLPTTNAQSDAVHQANLHGKQLHNTGFGLGNALKQNTVDRLATTNTQTDAAHQANLHGKNLQNTGRETANSMNQLLLQQHQRESEISKVLHGETKGLSQAAMVKRVQALEFDNYKSIYGLYRAGNTTGALTLINQMKANGITDAAGINRVKDKSGDVLMVVVNKAGEPSIDQRTGEPFIVNETKLAAYLSPKPKPEGLIKVGKDDSVYNPATGQYSQPPAPAADLYGGGLGESASKVISEILKQSAGLEGESLAQGVDAVMAMSDEGSPQTNAYTYARQLKAQQNLERTTQHILNLTPKEIMQRAGVDLSAAPITPYEAKGIAEDLANLPSEQRQGRLIELLKRKAEVLRMNQVSQEQMEARRYMGTDYDVD